MGADNSPAIASFTVNTAIKLTLKMDVNYVNVKRILVRYVISFFRMTRMTETSLYIHIADLIVFRAGVVLLMRGVTCAGLRVTINPATQSQSVKVRIYQFTIHVHVYKWYTKEAQGKNNILCVQSMPQFCSSIVKQTS